MRQARISARSLVRFSREFICAPSTLTLTMAGLGPANQSRSPRTRGPANDDSGWPARRPAMVREGNGTAPSSFLSAQKIAGDDELLNLARAFIDAEDAHVAIEAFDAVIGDVARAAENLHGAVRDPPDHFGCEIFAAGRFHRHDLARVALSGGVEHHAARGVGLRLR